jgi:hypothetical protein
MRGPVLDLALPALPVLLILATIGLVGGIGITALGPGGVLVTIGLCALTELPSTVVAGTCRGGPRAALVRSTPGARPGRR